MNGETLVLYVCDQKRHCRHSAGCGRDCRHTTEAKHAKYNDHVDFNDMTGEGKFLIEAIRET